MNIKRFLYIEQNEDHYISAPVMFSTPETAIAEAKRRLLVSIGEVFGMDFTIPPHCVDADGYITYEPDGIDACEISSCENGWSITFFQAGNELQRLAYIEPVDIPVSHDEAHDIIRGGLAAKQAEVVQRLNALITEG